MEFRYLWHTQSFLNMHEQVPSESIDLNFYMSIHLNPYFVCAGSKGSGATAQTGWSLCCSWLVLVLSGHQREEYQNLLGWLLVVFFVLII